MIVVLDLKLKLQLQRFQLFSRKTMQKPMALALRMAAIALLTGCGTYIHTAKEETFDSFPTTTAPWRSLSNGVDVHWWFNCYKKADEHVEPRCDTMNMVAKRRGVAPDWHTVARTRQSHVSLMELIPIVPILSAHHGTTRRVLGMSTDNSGLAEFYILAAGEDAIDELEHRKDYKTMSSMDVWHNAVCTHQTMPVPRLVVEDERSLWVFADADSKPGCDKGRADWRAPLDMMTFDHPERYPDLLRKRMQLFYLDRTQEQQADFNMPRMATSDVRLLAKLPRSVVDLASVPTPSGKVFTLDDGQIDTALPTEPAANLRCNYTTTYFGWTVLANSPQRKLVGCKPYTTPGARAGR